MQPWVIRVLSPLACVLVRLALRFAAVGYSCVELMCTCAVALWCVAMGTSCKQIIVSAESLAVGCMVNQKVREIRVPRPILYAVRLDSELPRLFDPSTVNGKKNASNFRREQVSFVKCEGR